MSISSLGGPLRREYLTLPRTKTMDAISFATGGFIPEINDASDEELQAMVQRGELDPNIATKIIMERASRESRSASTEAPTSQTLSNMVPQVVKDWWNKPSAVQPPARPPISMRAAGNPPPSPAAAAPPPPPVPTGPAFSAPPAGPVGQAPMELNPPQVIQPSLRESLGNAIGMPRKGGEQRFRPMPSDADRYNGPAPPPQNRVAPTGVDTTEDERVNRNKALDDYLWGTDKYATKEDAARAQREALGDRMGLAPYRAGASTALGLEGANAGVPPPFDLNSLPKPEYPVGGIGELPAPPAGAASADVGGIVQPDYPLPLDPALQTQPKSPYDDPNALTPALSPADPATTGGPAGRPTMPTPDPTVMEMAKTPAGQQAVSGADSLFGNGRGWEALMMLGLGMAASKNPSALGALAEGGIGAVKYMGERRKEDRDERRLSQQDRRLDNSEMRSDEQLRISRERLDLDRKNADANSKLSRDRFDFEQGKEARRAPLDEEEKKSQIQYRKAMTEYYNTGGRGANANKFTPAERVSQSRMIMKEADDYAKEVLKDKVVMDDAEKAKLLQQYREGYLRQYGFTTEGLSKVFSDAFGNQPLPSVANPSTNPSGGFSIKSINGKPYSP